MKSRKHLSKKKGSLSNFVERFAKTLRTAASPSKDAPSLPHLVEQIALMLRQNKDNIN